MPDQGEVLILRKTFSATAGDATIGEACLVIPQRLKPNLFQSIYVRAEARTLHGPTALPLWRMSFFAAFKGGRFCERLFLEGVGSLE
jgi:hypothetical protein